MGVNSERNIIEYYSLQEVMAYPELFGSTVYTTLDGYGSLLVG